MLYLGFIATQMAGSNSNYNEDNLNERGRAVVYISPAFGERPNFSLGETVDELGYFGNGRDP